MKTIIRRFLLAAIAFIPAITVTSCSDKDSPLPNPSESQDTVISESFDEKDYQEKLAGSLWISTSAIWRDNEGNELGDAGDIIGGFGYSRYLYTGPDCIVEFYSTAQSPYSIKLSGTIDPETKLLGGRYTTSTNIYFDSLDKDILTTRTKLGQWSEGGNVREDVCLYVTYKRVEAGYTSTLFSLYTPNNFNPEELDLPPLPDKISKDMFDALTCGFVWRTRGEAEWKDKEGNTLSTGAKFGVTRYGYLYIGDGFYLYPGENGMSKMVKGTFEEDSQALANVSAEETDKTVYVDRLTANNIFVHSGEGLYKDNGVVRNDVAYYYSYFASPLSLKEFLEMFPPEDFTLSEVGL